MVDRGKEAGEVSRADQLETAGRSGEALDAARSSPRAFPNGDVLVVEARALARLGRYDAAARAYRRALQHDPTDWTAQRDLALVLALAGERAAARAEMARALALNPGMSLPFGFARREDLAKVRREQRRAARAAAGLAPPP